IACGRWYAFRQHNCADACNWAAVVLTPLGRISIVPPLFVGECLDAFLQKPIAGTRFRERPMPCSDDTAVAVSRARGPWKKRILFVLGGMTVVAVCAVVRFAWLDGEANAQQRAPRRFYQRQP